MLSDQNELVKTLEAQRDAALLAKNDWERKAADWEQRFAAECRELNQAARTTDARHKAALAAADAAHSEQLENLRRRIAEGETAKLALIAERDAALATVKSQGIDKAALHERVSVLQGELNEARAIVESARVDMLRHRDLLASARAASESQEQVLARLTADRASTERELRAAIDGQAQVIDVLQLNLAKLNGHPILRMARGAARLFTGSRAPDEPQNTLFPTVRTAGIPDDGNSQAAPPSRLTDAPKPSIKSESTLAATPSNDLVHVQQLLSLRGQAFIEAAYAAILNRNPDPAGLQHYLGQLQRVHDKRQILVDLATSKEGRARKRPVAGLDELIVSRSTGPGRFWRWFNRRFGEGLASRRTAAAIDALGDELDARLQRMEGQMQLLGRTLDATEKRLGARLDVMSRVLEVSLGQLAGSNPSGSGVVVSPLSPRTNPSVSVDASQPASQASEGVAGSGLLAAMLETVERPDAFSCALRADSGSGGLIDSLSRHLATTAQAKTLSNK
jgi:hypothetical protein